MRYKIHQYYQISKLHVFHVPYTVVTTIFIYTACTDSCTAISHMSSYSFITLSQPFNCTVHISLDPTEQFCNCQLLNDQTL